MRTFEENMERLGLKPFPITFNVTEDVYNELIRIADSNDTNLEDMMRDIIDDFLMNQPE